MISILVKATILLALGLMASRLASRARASVRHLLLAATFAALLALPAAVLITPDEVSIRIPVSRSLAAAATTPSPAQPSAAVVNSPVLPSLSTVWIAGTLLFLASLLVDLWRVRRIRRHGVPWLENRQMVPPDVELLLHEDIPAPFTCGVLRPAIVLPSDARNWSEADLHRALIHELEHIRRGDWAVQLVARVACACYWFHPLAWSAWRKLCLEAERACDDVVVQSADNAEYAEQLVLLARRMSHARAQLAPGMANRRDLSARVSAVLDGNQPRGRASFLAAAAAMTAAGLVVLALAPIEAVAQSSNRRTPFDRSLYEAAEEGNVDDIATLLNSGANVNAKLSGDGSPLIAAARNGHLAAVRLLLDRGADVNMPVSGDGNPLIMAAREGRLDIVTLLLDRDANINQIVPGDENALIQASREGRLEVVRLLINRRADVNARVRADSEWRTPLSMARRGGHEAVVALLIAAGARE